MDTVQWIKTLESRVLGNGQARFGGGPGEKDWKQHLACGLSYFVILHPEKEMLDKAAEILQNKGITPVEKVHIVGRPAAAIVDYADKNGIDVIVLGNVSSKILERADIPVLIIKG